MYQVLKAVAGLKFYFTEDVTFTIMGGMRGA